MTIIVVNRHLRTDKALFVRAKCTFQDDLTYIKGSSVLFIFQAPNRGILETKCPLKNPFYQPKYLGSTLEPILTLNCVASVTNKNSSKLFIWMQISIEFCPLPYEIPQLFP